MVLLLEETLMQKASLFFLVLFLCAASVAAPQPLQSAGSDDRHYFSARFEDLTWQKIAPELGADSPEIAILRVDPATGATQLLIRNPRRIHVRPHWHSANETHTIDRKSTRLNSSHIQKSRMPSSA